MTRKPNTTTITQHTHAPPTLGIPCSSHSQLHPFPPTRARRETWLGFSSALPPSPSPPAAPSPARPLERAKGLFSWAAASSLPTCTASTSAAWPAVSSPLLAGHMELGGESSFDFFPSGSVAIASADTDLQDQGEPRGQQGGAEGPAGGAPPLLHKEVRAGPPLNIRFDLFPDRVFRAGAAWGLDVIN
uniref:Uncharacterized protein n=2 Tax=Aegilops tauschii subsp. strangulata TaxID=200361 RepID=A0A452ZR25_AEGTS